MLARNHAYELTSKDGESVQKTEVLELMSDQEETDTRVVIYAMYGSSKGYKSLRVRSPDSDIFFILLHHAQRIQSELYFDTGSGNKRRLINVSKLAIKYGPQNCSALLGLHAFTGCDTTSSFKGIAKVKPLKLMLKKSKFESEFAKLGESWEVPDDLIVELESFTCGMYCNTKISSVDSLCLSILTKKCGNPEKLDPRKTVDLTTLPPCSSTLLQHIRRANYQVAVWKGADDQFLEVPPAEGHGWVAGDLGLEPLWCEGPILPDGLSELLEDAVETDSEEEYNYDSDSSTEESDID